VLLESGNFQFLNGLYFWKPRIWSQVASFHCFPEWDVLFGRDWHLSSGVHTCKAALYCLTHISSPRICFRKNSELLSQDTLVLFLVLSLAFLWALFSKSLKQGAWQDNIKHLFWIRDVVVARAFSPSIVRTWVPSSAWGRWVMQNKTSLLPLKYYSTNISIVVKLGLRGSTMKTLTSFWKRHFHKTI
jgi:hypothetical protein